jgi:pyridoxamine 5'-phosphate oxidase
MNTDPFVLNPLLSTIRQEFVKGQLMEDNINKNPIIQFETWLQEAFSNGNPTANAMILSTVDVSGMPSSRVMLLRDISFGGFTFFSNYESKKGTDVETNNKASLLFFWPELERQVRIQGFVEKLPKGESDAYFESRPFESKVGAWASKQSQIIEGREVLEKNFAALLNKYDDKKVPRPDHWGGYVLYPVSIEFWQGRESRLHDRLLFKRVDHSHWKMDRLMP